MRSVVTWLVGVAAVMTAVSAQQRELTHDDLGNALITLAKDIRENSARLERHELRERQLGEHLKKTMAGLEKRLKSQDSVLETLRTTVGQVESSLQQRDERERIQLQRTLEAVDRLGTTLETWMTRYDTASSSGTSEVELRALRERLEQALQYLTAGGSTAGSSDDLVVASEKLREAASNLVAGETRWRQFGDDSEKLIAELRAAVEKMQTKPEPANDAVDGEEETPHLGAILDSLEASQRILTDAASSFDENIRNLGLSTSGKTADNSTLRAVAALREDLLRSNELTKNIIIKNITLSLAETKQGQSEIKSSLSEIRAEENKNFEAIRGVEKVILQTADGVLDTKRRVEYGVQQILFDTGELVNDKVKELNESMTVRFDALTATILLNQTNALTNLSARMEAEISQVWRQIGIMYRQLSQSAGTLDRLQSQTESYVNGSLTTMDNMSGKVGQLSSSMAEVDDNLNYLLGRLSLVTQEFNMIKGGLGDALDQARQDFLTLQESLQLAVSDASAKHPIRGPIDDNRVLGGEDRDVYREE